MISVKHFNDKIFFILMQNLIANRKINAAGENYLTIDQIYRNINQIFFWSEGAIALS